MTRGRTTRRSNLRTSGAPGSRAGLIILVITVLVGCGERGPRIVVFADGGPLPVADVEVFPDRVTLFSLGDTIRFVAAPLDSLGNVIEDVTVVWASQDVGIASITQDGLALARGQGQTVITATAGDAQGRAFLAVSLQGGATAAARGAVKGGS